MAIESARVQQFGTTVFTEFSRLAAEAQAVNLGQGFPDFDGPLEIKAAAKDAIDRGVNQYAFTAGAAELRQAIAAHAERFYGQRVDPDTMVSVTSGATEAIFDAAMGLLSPGDEAILFEPYYDSYLASVQMAGATPRYVRLRPPDTAHRAWWFDERELAQAFSARTKLVFLNTPHNPTGKVFTAEELTSIGTLAKLHGAVVLSDEVYEHLVFAPAKHVRPATLPGLGANTLTISSGGQELLLHRLEGGLGARAARAGARGAEGAPVGHLRHRRPVAGGDRPGAEAARRLLRRVHPHVHREARPAGPGARARAG